jgi:uncharacterized protein YbjT (DUF2867 family)
MILVTGATGTNGVELIKELVNRNEGVRALVRDPVKAEEILPESVELARGEFEDAESLDEAMEDVEKMFLLGPVKPSFHELEAGAIDAAKRAGVKHVVKLSVWHVDPNATTNFAKLHGWSEQHLRRSGLGWTMLRPTFFMQNWLGLGGMIKSGSIYQPAGDGKAPYIDVRDIAAVAATVLSEAGHEGKAYSITGPRDLSYHDVASAVSKVIGKPVNYVDVPRDAAKQSMLQMGMSDWQAESILELTDLLKAGKMSGVSGDVRKVTGKPPRSIEQFLSDHAAAFR